MGQQFSASKRENWIPRQARNDDERMSADREGGRVGMPFSGILFYNGKMPAAVGRRMEREREMRRSGKIAF